MGRDMERDRLASQHGHDSFQTRQYDQRVAEQQAQEDAARWKRYGDVTGRTIGTGTGGTGDVGEAVAKLLTAGCVLLLLYGVWLFAIEAAKALTTVWGQFLYAVAHPFGAGHAFLIACFALSLLALWTVCGEWRCTERCARGHAQ